MYNTKYECMYNSLDTLEAIKDLEQHEKEEICDVLYKQDILNVFDVDDYNDDLINKEIHDLYEKIKNHVEFKICMSESAKMLMTTDEEIGLTILFSFNYFHFTHLCLCEFLTTGNISNENIELLKKNIK